MSRFMGCSLAHRARAHKRSSIRAIRAEIQTVTLQPQDVLFHHGDTEGTENFTEASGFSVHLRVLRVSVVSKVLEFFSRAWLPPGS